MKPNCCQQQVCAMAGFGVLILSFSLFKLCRGTSRNWSALAFRFATLLRPPKPATAQTPTLWLMPADKKVILKMTIFGDI
jgi:hypothetical protein